MAMNEEKQLSAENRHGNIRHLRQYLKMTQKAFLETFFMDEEGKPKMSIATLSNMEARGGARLEEVISELTDRLGISEEAFCLPPDEFTKRLDTVLVQSGAAETFQSDAERKGNISGLVNRLTM